MAADGTRQSERVEIEDLERLDIRVGTVREVRGFPEARKELYRLTIDFGPEIGTMRSAAGLPDRYRPAELEGRQVLAVVNLPPRPIAGFVSECLTLGVPDQHGEPILVVPERPVPDGGRLY